MARDGGNARGSLAFDGIAAKGWSARLGTQDVQASSSIGDDGRFELQIRTSGSCALSCKSPSMSGGELRIFAPLELEAGENAWQYDFETGRLRLAGLPPATARGDEYYQHTYELPWDPPESGPNLSFAFEPDATGAIEVDGLPGAASRCTAASRRTGSAARARSRSRASRSSPAGSRP